jgi:hypothetical protein
LKRYAALVLLLGAIAPAAASEYVQAVEFPYYLYPRSTWERQLVWIKNVGVDTVEFTIPANYHQTSGGAFDLTGATGPRRDLLGLIRLLRKLGLRAWVRPLDAAPGLIPPHLDVAGQRAWALQLEQTLAPQTVAHGGPIAFVESRVLAIEASTPPSPVTTISATDANGLARSREAMRTGIGALLWTDAQDAIYPAGWAANPNNLLRKGAVSLSGEERPSALALRRNAALLRSWARMFERLRPVAMPRPAAGSLPEGLTAGELESAAAGAVSITNASSKPFHDDVRVLDPATRHTLIVPGVDVPPGQSLWLPVGVSLGPAGLCRDCSKFAPLESIVYATAELLTVEFENGILAMEFAAPQAGEVVLQLERQPTGPLLAAGKPTEFDWDEAHLRARLPIPASKQADFRVRIAIAMEAPETSAFFNDLHRLVIGKPNSVSTMYSSAAVAARSRIRLPEGYTATTNVKSPNEIDAEIAVPSDAIPGDIAVLALEADGTVLGRERVPLFRPSAVRVVSALRLHFGQAAEIAPEASIAAIDSAGGNIEFAIRNNSMQIQTYHVTPSGPGLDFLPHQAEISIGPTDERRVEFRVFPNAPSPGLRDASLRVTGGDDLTLPFRLALIPRAGATAWTADLDGDGEAEWILESAKVRAVFSTQDGGRWIEFTWKDTGTNFLPESGLFVQPGAVEVRAASNALEFIGKGWKRTVTLNGASLSVQQSTPLSGEMPRSEKRGNITLNVERPTPGSAVFTLN